MRKAAALPLSWKFWHMHKDGKRFIFHGPTRDMQHFEALATQAARLKPYGDVLLVISEIADKGFHEIPEGGSG
ncbi:MAG: hypothetical protein WD079_04175, partial [Phycisphaeraceae bacterium]